MFDKLRSLTIWYVSVAKGLVISSFYGRSDRLGLSVNESQWLDTPDCRNVILACWDIRDSEWAREKGFAGCHWVSRGLQRLLVFQPVFVYNMKREQMHWESDSTQYHDVILCIVFMSKMILRHYVEKKRIIQRMLRVAGLLVVCINHKKGQHFFEVLFSDQMICVKLG